MFYSHVEVKIPAKKRIRKTEPHYVYEILSRKGPGRKERVVCVGVATKEGMMNPNGRYYDIHKEAIEEKPLDEPAQFDSQVHIGASMAMRKIARDEGLSEILERSFPGRSELIMSLVEYYMIRRDSAAQLYKYYLSDHYTELNYVPSETEISNLFNKRMVHEAISGFLSGWMTHRLSLKTASRHIDLDFDSTNRNVSSKGVSSAEYGKAKVDEGLPQVNTAYFLDRDTGLPIYFDVYYGSIIDMSHCKIAMDKIKAIKSDAEGMIVMDRGYFSSQNLDYLSSMGFSLMCMGKAGKTLSGLIAAHPKEAISSPKNRVFGSMFGLKLEGKPFEGSGRDYHIYLYYNESDVAGEIARIQDEIEYACSFLPGKKDAKGEIRNTYGKRIDLEVDDEGIIVGAKPNYGYIESYKREFGYFWIVSTEDKSPKDVIQSYRFRDAVEKEMKYSKSQSDLDKTFASSDTAFEAKMLLGFLSAIVRSSLSIRLKNYVIGHSSETTQTILLELDKIKAEEIQGKYVLRYALTAKQREILTYFGLTLKDVYKAIDAINFARKLTPKK